MRYPLTFYVKSLPANVGGCANGPVIRILEKYRGDEGIYQHELVHVGQWLAGAAAGAAAAVALLLLPELAAYHQHWPTVLMMGITLHPLLYLVWHGYRLRCEVAAYREQALYYAADRRLLFAGFIANNYGLRVTTAQAYQLLKEGA